MTARPPGCMVARHPSSFASATCLPHLPLPSLYEHITSLRANRNPWQAVLSWWRRKIRRYERAQPQVLTVQVAVGHLRNSKGEGTFPNFHNFRAQVC